MGWSQRTSRRDCARESFGKGLAWQGKKDCQENGKTFHSIQMNTPLISKADGSVLQPPSSCCYPSAGKPWRSNGRGLHSVRIQQVSWNIAHGWCSGRLGVILGLRLFGNSSIFSTYLTYHTLRFSLSLSRTPTISTPLIVYATFHTLRIILPVNFCE